MEPDPLSPPPFEFVNEAAFEADMTNIVPNEKVRDDVVDSLGWTITHTLVGLAKPFGITALTGTSAQVIVTQKTAICPALRVLFSVQDEPPKRRWITFLAASLREQNGFGL
jgi:hypothetical protein